MEWYYAQDNQRLGPVTEQEFSALLQRGTITPQTYVWHKGMEDWVLYGTLAPAASQAAAPQAMNVTDLTSSGSLADDLLGGDISASDPQGMDDIDLSFSSSLAADLLGDDAAVSGTGLFTCAECREFFDANEVTKYQGQTVCDPCNVDRREVEERKVAVYQRWAGFQYYRCNQRRAVWTQ